MSKPNIYVLSLQINKIIAQKDPKDSKYLIKISTNTQFKYLPLICVFDKQKMINLDQKIVFCMSSLSLKRQHKCIIQAIEQRQKNGQQIVVAKTQFLILEAKTYSKKTFKLQGQHGHLFTMNIVVNINSQNKKILKQQEPRNVLRLISKKSSQKSQQKPLITLKKQSIIDIDLPYQQNPIQLIQNYDSDNHQGHNDTILSKQILSSQYLSQQKYDMMDDQKDSMKHAFSKHYIQTPKNHQENIKQIRFSQEKLPGINIIQRQNCPSKLAQYSKQVLNNLDNITPKEQCPISKLFSGFKAQKEVNINKIKYNMNNMIDKLDDIKLGQQILKNHKFIQNIADQQVIKQNQDRMNKMKTINADLAHSLKKINDKKIDKDDKRQEKVSQLKKSCLQQFLNINNNKKNNHRHYLNRLYKAQSFHYKPQIVRHHRQLKIQKISNMNVVINNKQIHKFLDQNNNTPMFSKKIKSFISNSPSPNKFNNYQHAFKPQPQTHLNPFSFLNQTCINLKVQQQSLIQDKYIKLRQILKITSKTQQLHKDNNSFLTQTNQQLLYQLKKIQKKYLISQNLNLQKQSIIKTQLTNIMTNIKEMSDKQIDKKKKKDQQQKIQQKVKKLQEQIQIYVRQINGLKEEKMKKNNIVQEIKQLLWYREDQAQYYQNILKKMKIKYNVFQSKLWKVRNQIKSVKIQAQDHSLEPSRIKHKNNDKTIKIDQIKTTPVTPIKDMNNKDDKSIDKSIDKSFDKFAKYTYQRLMNNKTMNQSDSKDKSFSQFKAKKQVQEDISCFFDDFTFKVTKQIADIFIQKPHNLKQKK